MSLKSKLNSNNQFKDFMKGIIPKRSEIKSLTSNSPFVDYTLKVVPHESLDSYLLSLSDTTVDYLFRVRIIYELGLEPIEKLSKFLYNIIFNELIRFINVLEEKNNLDSNYSLELTQQLQEINEDLYNYAKTGDLTEQTINSAIKAARIDYIHRVGYSVLESIDKDVLHQYFNVQKYLEFDNQHLSNDIRKSLEVFEICLLPILKNDYAQALKKIENNKQRKFKLFKKRKNHKDIVFLNPTALDLMDNKDRKDVIIDELLSSLIGGADADLIVGDTLYDFKLSKVSGYRWQDWAQLIGYALIFKEDANFDLKRVCIYQARYGEVVYYDLEDLYNDFPKLINEMKATL